MGAGEMNRKEKKQLREKRTVQQLMGIKQLTRHGVLTANGELVFFLISPDNLSILSGDGVRGRITALSNLLQGIDNVRLLAPYHDVVPFSVFPGLAAAVFESFAGRKGECRNFPSLPCRRVSLKVTYFRIFSNVTD